MNPYQYNLLELAVGQTVDFGSSVGVSFDGDHAFSIGMWIRLNAQANQATIFAKGGEFQITLSDQTVSCAIAGQASPVTASVPLALYQWHYLVAVGALSGGAGTLSLYLDGDCVGQATMTGVGTAATSAPFAIGGNLTAELLSVAFFASSLDPDDCGPQWQTTPAGDDLVGIFDFTCYPAADTSGNGNPVNLNAGAAQLSTTSAAALLASSWVTPDREDNLNPGGAGAAAFSVQAWVNVQPPTLDASPQTIVANGPAGAAGAFALSYQYNDTSGAFTLGTQLSGTAVTAASTVAPGTWHNVAVTYDGTTLTLYLDAQVAGTAAPSPTALAEPDVLFGAAHDQTSPDGLGSFLGGYLQGLAIWERALSAAEVARAMSTPFGALSEHPGKPPKGCVAYYDLASADPSNLVTGRHASFHESAAVTEVYGAPIDASPAARPAPAPRAARHPLRAMARRLGITGEARPTGTLLDARFDGLIAEYDRLLRRLAPDHAERLRRRFTQNLYLGAELQRRAAAPLPGTVTFERQGGDWVFYGHSESGREEAGRVPVDQLTECQSWIISVVATSVCVLMAALGVGFATKAILNNVARQMARESMTVYGTFKRVIPAPTEVASTTPIKLVQTFSLSGSLVSTIAAGLVGVSWWSWLFTVASIVISIAALWLTGGWFLLVILANLALSIAQLIAVIEQRPAGC